METKKPWTPTHEITYRGEVVLVAAVIPSAPENALGTQAESESGGVAAWTISYGVLSLRGEDVSATWRALPAASNPALIDDPAHKPTTRPGPGLG